MPISGRKVERRALILLLEVGVTARSKKLICDGRLPILGLDEQLCGPMRVLLVDEGLRALCRQQRANLRCVTIKRGIPKLLSRHSCPLILDFIYWQLAWTTSAPLAICQGIKHSFKAFYFFFSPN